MLKSTHILGVKVTTEKESEILEFIGNELGKSRSKRRKIVIFTPNPEQLSAASRDSSLKSLLNQSDINLPDGVGVVVAARLTGRPIERRISGVDFMQSLVKSNSKRPIKTGYFGGQRGVAESAANCLQKMAILEAKKEAEISIGYASDGFDKERMMHSDIDILFVGLGFPKQEKWIMEHKDEVPATVIMAVGGSLDFISGRIPRAPKAVRNLGGEWLFRLIIQPWRFLRQLQLLHFGALIFVEALSSRLKLNQESRIEN